MKTIFLVILSAMQFFAQSSKFGTLGLLMADDGIKYNSNITAYFDSLVTPLDDTVKQFYSDLCDCLDDNLNGGARDKTLLQLGFDRIGLFATQTQEAAKRDLVVRTNYTEVSDIAWTQWRHYQGDGAADYINTEFNPASGTNNYSLNSGTFAIYLRNSVNTAVNYPVHGSQDLGGRRIGIRERNDSQVTSYLVINSSTIPTLNGNGAGFYAAFRTHADTSRGVRNTTFMTPALVTSVATPNLTIWLGGINLNNGLSAANTHQIAYWFMGKGWYNAEITKIKNCFNSFLSKVGAGI